MEVNLTGALLLGVERSTLLDKPFALFVAREHRDIFYAHRQSILSDGGKNNCEIMLLKKGKTLFYASLESILAQDKTAESLRIRTAISDISERKRMEKALQESEGQLKRLSAQLLTLQEKERQEITRELHDGIGQFLAAMKFRIEAILNEMRKSSAWKKIEPLQTLIPAIQENLEEIRRIQLNLRPSILDDFGVLATICWFCREFNNNYGGLIIEQEISIQEEEIPDYLKLVIYRIVQEALNNISKHSRADTARLFFKIMSELNWLFRIMAVVSIFPEFYPQKGLDQALVLPAYNKEQGCLEVYSPWKLQKARE